MECLLFTFHCHLQVGHELACLVLLPGGDLRGHRWHESTCLLNYLFLQGAQCCLCDIVLQRDARRLLDGSAGAVRSPSACEVFLSLPAAARVRWLNAQWRRGAPPPTTEQAANMHTSCCVCPCSGTPLLFPQALLGVFALDS